MGIIEGMIYIVCRYMYVIVGVAARQMPVVTTTTMMTIWS